MAVVVANHNDAQNTYTDTSLQIPVSSGTPWIAVDDLIVIILGHASSKTPSLTGFTEITGSSNASTSNAIIGYYRIATSADVEATSYTINFGSGYTTGVGAILKITGAGTSPTIAAVNRSGSSYGQLLGPTTLTTTVDNSLVLWSFTTNANLSSSYPTSGVTEIVQRDVGTALGLNIGSTVQETAGSVTGHDSAQYNSNWASNAIAIGSSSAPSGSGRAICLEG